MTTNERALTITPKSLSEVQSLADVLSKSVLLPDALKGKTADITVQVLAGAELGLAPMASIRGVHIVQGKPVLAADTMIALVLGSGLCEYFSCTEETATSVTYETKRKGSPYPQRFTWTDEDSKKAGLSTKDNYRLYGRQMKRARCKAVLARDVFPDVLAGCYDPDELQQLAREQAPSERRHSDAVDAEIVSETPVADDLIAQIDVAKSKADLEALVPQLKKLGNGRLTEARARYNARIAALETPA
jgi:hypothetical protein